MAKKRTVTKNKDGNTVKKTVTKTNRRGTVSKTKVKTKVGSVKVKNKIKTKTTAGGKKIITTAKSVQKDKNPGYLNPKKSVTKTADYEYSGQRSSRALKKTEKFGRASSERKRVTRSGRAFDSTGMETGGSAGIRFNRMGRPKKTISGRSETVKSRRRPNYKKR